MIIPPIIIIPLGYNVESEIRSPPLRFRSIRFGNVRNVGIKHDHSSCITNHGIPFECTRNFFLYVFVLVLWKKMRRSLVPRHQLQASVFESHWIGRNKYRNMAILSKHGVPGPSWCAIYPVPSGYLKLIFSL